MTTDGRRVLIVSRRDIAHPLAGAQERYLHEIAVRWAASGTLVTWAAARPRGMPARDVIDGVELVRRRMLPHRRFDAIVDATGRRSIMTWRVPVVRVVHQQPASGRPRRWRGAIAVLSPSARHELRRSGHRGPIFVVPPGSAADPTTWDRSASLLAGVVTGQLGARGGAAQRRYARSDIATVVQFAGCAAPGPLRATDEVSVVDGVVSVLLNGCDEFDALGVLDRIGVTNARLRLATWDDVLVGPRNSLPTSPKG